MKKLRKISRVEMRTVQGGIAKGMMKCQDPETCELVWGYPTGMTSNCNGLAPICGEVPADPCVYNICL